MVAATPRLSSKERTGTCRKNEKLAANVAKRITDPHSVNLIRFGSENFLAVGDVSARSEMQKVRDAELARKTTYMCRRRFVRRKVGRIDPSSAPIKTCLRERSEDFQLLANTQTKVKNRTRVSCTDPTTGKTCRSVLSMGQQTPKRDALHKHRQCPDILIVSPNTQKIPGNRGGSLAHPIRYHLGQRPEFLPAPKRGALSQLANHLQLVLGFLSLRLRRIPFVKRSGVQREEPCMQERS